MTLKEKLELAWKNRHQIAEGLYNTYISHDEDIKAEAARRKSICETNKCGLYDAEGKAATSVIPGRPACSGCHCNIEYKVNCMVCWCTLGDDGEGGSRKTMDRALWTELLTQEMDNDINTIRYNKQFEKK